jgi:hypothetical protein
MWIAVIGGGSHRVPGKQTRREYWGYVALFAAGFLLLFALNAIPLLLRTDVGLAEKIRRLAVITPVALVSPFICAACPLVIPRLWLRLRNRQDGKPGNSN